MPKSSDCNLLLRGVHVLAVEDDEDEREMLTLVLRQRGARITAVSSATQALAVIEQDFPDILLSDVTLPEMDGYELLKRVREYGSARRSRLPAVALTGWSSAEDRARSIDCGFQVHLSKPVELETLVAVLASLAAARRVDIAKEASS